MYTNDAFTFCDKYLVIAHSEKKLFFIKFTALKMTNLNFIADKRLWLVHVKNLDINSPWHLSAISSAGHTWFRWQSQPLQARRARFFVQIPSGGNVVTWAE